MGAYWRASGTLATLRLLGQGCVGIGSPIFLGPTISLLPSVLELGLGEGCQDESCCSLCPPCTSSLTPSLCLHRLQDFGKPQEEGQGRAGSTRGEPTPAPACSPPWLFSPFVPLFLLSLLLGLRCIFRAGRKHGRASSFLSLAHVLPAHTTDPQLLPGVLTPGLGRWLMRKTMVACG